MRIEKPEFGSRLPILDGWRAISILAVIVGHLARWSNIGSGAHLNLLLNSWASLGVQIFFFISGFVICRGLLREEQRFGSIALLGFYVRRFFRIFPPLLLFLSVAIAGTVLGLFQSDVAGLLRGLTFTCNISVCGPWAGGHLWSLSAEEQFYILIPILFAALISRARVATPILAVGVPVVALALYSIHYTDAASFLVANFQCIALGVGCALHEPRVRSWAHRAPIWLVALAALIAVLVFDLPGSRFSTLTMLCLAPAIAILLLRSLDRSSWLSGFLLSSPIQYIGKISYSLYLWQQLATGPYQHAGATFYLIAVVSVFAVACGSWFLIERPAIEIGKRISRGIRERRLAQLAETA
jgi:peptidoglycan/LPS O-acetylase OafA/YrhL